MRFIMIPLVLAGFGIQAGCWLLLRGNTFAFDPVRAILILLGVSPFYLYSCYLTSTKRVDSRSALLLIGVFTLVFRFTVLPMLPSLTEDLARYRWEGMLQGAGGNPYQIAPMDPAWSHLRDSTWSQIAAKDFRGGYGPAWMLMERGMWELASRITSDPSLQLLWFKLPSCLGDLAVILILIRMAVPTVAVVAWAWCPLVITEFWWSGHNDSVMLALLVWAVYLAEQKRWTWAFASLAGAGLVKLWPFLLFPLFLFRERIRWRPALIALPLAAVAVAPFWSPVSINASFLSGFLGGWRNNDSLFGFIWWASKEDPVRAKYLSLGLLAAGSLLVAALRPALERGIFGFTAFLLLISANVHPWYVTWLLPWVCLTKSLTGLVWASLMPLCYAVLIGYRTLGLWEGSTAWRWWVYLPVFITGGWELLRRRMRN